MDKTKYMHFNQKREISTLNGGSQKLVDKIIYLRSSVTLTKNDINTQLAKAWTAINRLSVIWKLAQSDELKCSFFPSSGRVNTAIWMHHMDADKAYWGNSLMAITQECYQLYWKIPGVNTQQRSSCTATNHPSWKPFKLDEQDMQDTAGEVRSNSEAMYFCGPFTWPSKGRATS